MKPTDEQERGRAASKITRDLKDARPGYKVKDQSIEDPRETKRIEELKRRKTKGTDSPKKGS